MATTQATPAPAESSAAGTLEQGADFFSSLLNEEAGETTTDQPPAESEPEKPAADEPEETEPATDDEPKEAAQTYKVKVEDREIEVTLDELLSGYKNPSERADDAQVSEQRKAYETEVQAARQVREQYIERLKLIEQSLAEPQIDWSALAQNDPQEWMRQKILQQDRVEARRVAEQERTQAEEQNAAEAHERRSRMVSEETTKLLKAIPEWKDAAKASAEKKELAGYAKKLGFTDQDLAQVTDHRVLLLLRDAKSYRDLVAKKDTMRAATPQVKTAKPGAQPAAGSSGSLKKATERLAQSKSIEAGASFFEALLESEQS